MNYFWCNKYLIENNNVVVIMPIIAFLYTDQKVRLFFPCISVIELVIY